ncbi:hypothetical protein VP01_4110g2, partial [Puccinia sorghi]
TKLTQPWSFFRQVRIHRFAGPFSCHNLPPLIQNKLSHMCIAGITPGPYSPDPQTFNHLLGPIVDELITLDAGILIPTYQFPAGRSVQFCSFFHAEKSQIPALKLSRRQEKAETISSACSSQDAESHNDRHVVGVMHNWIEGILQGHFRYRWKFGQVQPSEARAKRQNHSTLNSCPKKRTRLTVQSTTDIDPEDFWARESYFSNYVSTNENEDNDILLNSGFGGSFFTEDDIDQFNTLLRQVVLPPGVPNLPLNLGEAAHGKLSASQWHSLFVFIIPLVICKMYIPNVANVDLSSARYKFLEKTAQLVQSPVLFLLENSSKGTSKDLKQTTKEKDIQVQLASYLKTSKYNQIITLRFTFLNRCLIGALWLVSLNFLGCTSLDSYRK